MIGTREFDEWMNLTVSNKHWLLAFALGTIGGCVGWIAYRLMKRGSPAGNNRGRGASPPAVAPPQEKDDTSV